MTQALAGQAVLSWFGVATELVLGAASADGDGPTKDVDFHAWLTWNGQVILGGQELEEKAFSPLSRLPSLQV